MLLYRMNNLVCGDLLRTAATYEGGNFYKAVPIQVHLLIRLSGRFFCSSAVEDPVINTKSQQTAQNKVSLSKDARVQPLASMQLHETPKQLLSSRAPSQFPPQTPFPATWRSTLYLPGSLIILSRYRCEREGTVNPVSPKHHLFQPVFSWLWELRCHSC